MAALAARPPARAPGMPSAISLARSGGVSWSLSPTSTSVGQRMSLSIGRESRRAMLAACCRGVAGDAHLARPSRRSASRSAASARRLACTRRGMRAVDDLREAPARGQLHLCAARGAGLRAYPGAPWYPAAPPAPPAAAPGAGSRRRCSRPSTVRPARSAAAPRPGCARASAAMLSSRVWLAIITGRARPERLDLRRVQPRPTAAVRESSRRAGTRSRRVRVTCAP